MTEQSRARSVTCSPVTAGGAQRCGNERSKTVSADAVVLGLGYVGLPLAQEAVRSGLSVVGFDVSPQVVDGLNAGESHVDDLSDGDVAQMLAGGFTASTEESVISAAEVAVICEIGRAS